jgi:hypothetical protein
MRDTRSATSIARSANLTVGNNSQNSALVDMQGYQGLEVWANTNTVTAAGAGIAFKLQHSNSTAAGTFVDVPAALRSGAIANVTLDTEDDMFPAGSINYLGNLRYVRAVATGGASTNAVLFFVFERGAPSSASQPVTKNFTLTAAT